MISAIRAGKRRPDDTADRDLARPQTTFCGLIRPVFGLLRRAGSAKPGPSDTGGGQMPTWLTYDEIAERRRISRLSDLLRRRAAAFL